jgi:hypothetical protein
MKRIGMQVIPKERLIYSRLVNNACADNLSHDERRVGFIEHGMPEFQRNMPEESDFFKIPEGVGDTVKDQERADRG